jgi:hypothetical protein
VENDESYFIYTHDESGLEREFEITDIDNFLENQENLPGLVLELQEKVAFQKDLKTGIELGVIQCINKNTEQNITRDEIEYLDTAIFNNMRTIRMIRKHLGWNSEPEIKITTLKTDILKSKRGMN